MKSAYNLLGRTFFIRRRFLYSLGLRLHINKFGMKDYFNPRNKMAYLITEAKDEGDHLLIPVVDTDNNLRAYYRFNKDKEATV